MLLVSTYCCIRILNLTILLIFQVLSEIRPYLVGTGGGILELVQIKDYTVKVRLSGPAAGVTTVRVALTQKLRDKIPAIAAVQLIDWCHIQYKFFYILIYLLHCKLVPFWHGFSRMKKEQILKSRILTFLLSKVNIYWAKINENDDNLHWVNIMLFSLLLPCYGSAPAVGCE